VAMVRPPRSRRWKAVPTDMYSQCQL
jgi:hypothetical protein